MAIGDPKLPFPVEREGDPTLGGPLKYFSALLHGGKCLLYESATFDDDPAIGLPNLPDAAQYALIYIEADATEAGNARVARFTEDGTTPEATVGMPAGDDFIYEVSGRSNLENFEIIGITAAKTHTLRVQYYGEG
ncbi:MAG: hypothetical protein WAU36_10365 [Cyclobacteriaceae bacterium]